MQQPANSPAAAYSLDLLHAEADLAKRLARLPVHDEPEAMSVATIAEYLTRQPILRFRAA